MCCRKEAKQLLNGHSIYKDLKTNQYTLLTERTTTEIKFVKISTLRVSNKI